MTTTTLHGVVTSQLRPGDVVLHRHGMRVQLGEILPSRSQRGVVYSRGLVLNLEEVRAEGVVPLSWLYEDGEQEPHWTIQGNDLATWVVEREACEECGTVEGVALNRHADGSLHALCEPCFVAGV